ncbi:unnamed protein product, partial [marine sediment metagenome]
MVLVVLGLVLFGYGTLSVFQTWIGGEVARDVLGSWFPSIVSAATAAETTSADTPVGEIADKDLTSQNAAPPSTDVVVAGDVADGLVAAGGANSFEESPEPKERQSPRIAVYE